MQKSVSPLRNMGDRQSLTPYTFVHTAAWASDSVSFISRDGQ